MTDIFLDQPKPGRKWPGLLLIIAAAAIAGGTLYWKRDAWQWPDKTPATTSAPTPASVTPPSRPPPPNPIPPHPALTDDSLQRLEEARQLKTEEKWLDAREKCFAVLEKTSNAVARADAEKLLGDINIALILFPRNMPEKVDYTVQTGDTLAGLAKRYGTTMDLIRKSNLIGGSVVRLGQHLRICNGKFSIQVSKTRNDLVLRLNDRFFKRYRVGTGQYGKTPVGTFAITSKLAQPPWTNPEDGKIIPYGSTNNVLGTHWMSLDVPGYGIHGTWQPETVGKQSSAGCIRLVNQEIEELYLLTPEGTQVTITE